MRIAIDISPLSTGHKVRGVGFYLLHLKNALQKYFPENEYIFFTHEKGISTKVDVVHYPYFDPFFLTLPFIKKYPTIVTIHDLTPIVFQKYFPVGIKGRVKWRVQKLSLQTTSGILVDSFCSQKDVHEKANIAKEKITVAYLAAGEMFQKLTSERLQKKSLLKKYQLPEQFALYVGDVTWNKNLPRLVEACIEKNIPLVMVGKALAESNYDTTNPWNVDRNTVLHLAENRKNIIRIGFVDSDELVKLYNLATLFVMPSLYEGFGLGVIEAMSCGTPVITSREGSLPEVGADAVFYTDAYDAHTIGNDIIKLFNDKNQQKILTEKGLIQAKKFNWEKTAQQTIAAYTKCL